MLCFKLSVLLFVFVHGGFGIVPGFIRHPADTDYFDWRDHDGVSEVKDQGSHCPACWAFSVTGNIESMYRIYMRMNPLLSEQMLIDCVEDNGGCNAFGNPLKAYAALAGFLGSHVLEKDYEYTGKQGRCHFNETNRNEYPVSGFHRVRPNDESYMRKMVVEVGPLTVGINSASMKKYSGGIDEPTDEDCSPYVADADHSVLIVGYNEYVDERTHKKTPYWIIKNSWGTDWGDKGFYYLVRGRNACGISNDVIYGLVY